MPTAVRVTITLYRCPHSVRWVRDDSYLILVDAEAGQSLRLEGLEAAVWAWLALGHTYDRILALVAATLRGDDRAARAMATLDALLARWAAGGWLRAEEAMNG